MIYCISDIHGNLAAFDDLLRKVKFKSPTDKLILLGDYIDWGRNSIGVLRRVRQLVENYPQNVIALMGNHELLLIASQVNETARMVWATNGGLGTKAQLEHFGELEGWAHWLQRLQFQYTEGRYIFCHSVPYNPNTPREEMNRNITLAHMRVVDPAVAHSVWARVDEDFKRSQIPEGMILVSGHTKAKNYGGWDAVYVSKNYVNIDCGAKRIPDGHGRLGMLVIKDNGKYKMYYSTKKDAM